MIHIHNSHFKIRDHTRSHAINFQSIFATKTVWQPFVVWHFAFQLYIIYGKQGLDAFDDGYVDGIYLLKLNQVAVHMPVAKKCRLLWTCTRFVFNRVETKGGSVLCFSQDKLTYIFRSRRKCNYTAVSWIINVSASLVSFFCKFRSTVQDRSFNWGGDFHAVVETPCSGEYFFCFTTLEAAFVQATGSFQHM